MPPRRMPQTARSHHGKGSLAFARLTFGLAVLALIGAIGITWLGLRFLHEEFPDVSVLRSRFPVVHYDAANDETSVSWERTKPAAWVTLAEVSKVAVGAILVSEDWAFYQHSGYDVSQIREAMKEDWEAGHFVRGASTITQQVARNVFLDQDKNLWRKLKELYLSMQLEKTVGKRRILETYLNIAEWGQGVYGLRAAARLYFNRTPDQLTAREGAFLAMLLPSPRRYSQSFRQHALTDYARETVDTILHKMTQARYLAEEELGREVHARLAFEIPEAAPSSAPSPGVPPSPADSPEDSTGSEETQPPLPSGV